MQRLRARLGAPAEHVDLPKRASRNDADCENEEIDLAELAGKIHGSFEEVLPAAGDAEEARQPSHDDCQPRAGFEADQDAVADRRTRMLSRSSQAIRQSKATVKAVRLAISA